MRFEFERDASLHLSMSNRCAIICCELLNFSERGFNGKRPVAPPTRRMVQAVSDIRSGTNRSMRMFGHCFELAREWFGNTREFPAYQWHFETFSIPQNAMRILLGTNCENQAFMLGPRIGLQPHIVVDERVIKLWAEKDRVMLKKLSGPGAQSYSTM